MKEDKCRFCNEEIGERISFNNRDEYLSFKYMNKNESAHLECYIDECIKIYINKNFSEFKL